jgi:hypothetical protein
MAEGDLLWIQGVCSYGVTVNSRRIPHRPFDTHLARAVFGLRIYRRGSLEVEKLVDREASRYRELDSERQLVHGDYNPGNRSLEFKRVHNNKFVP